MADAISDGLRVRMLRGEDAALLVGSRDLFDAEVSAAGAAAYFADPRNLMAGAVSTDGLVGFASALDHHHPDKRGELWINEISVRPDFRRQGVGRALIALVRAEAARAGLAAVWVLAEASDARAQAFYRALGGRADPATMFTFDPP